MSMTQILATLSNYLAPIYPAAKNWKYKFHGGIFPKYKKTLSSLNPIAPQLLPSELILPLAQAVGEPALPLVEVGARVKKNQLIAKADVDPTQKLMVPIHAPTSGEVIAIEPRALPHASGLQAPCLVLKPDGKNTAIENVLQSDGQWPKNPQPLKDLLVNSGIIGMGGAGFPTYAKLPDKRGHVQQLLINGAECEPFITCDDLLMQTQAKQIWLGAQITAQALGSAEILCGIEVNKPQAIKAMQQAAQEIASQRLDSLPMKIMEVATVYPMGSQKQLVLEMTGIELKAGHHAIDQNLLMMNVATLKAIFHAVEQGAPLTSRLVTVSGEGVNNGYNTDALIGTPFNELIELAKPKSKLDYPLIMGGPMMGVLMHENHVPVLKTTNCILANPPEPREMQMPCIRCGECMDACPVNLLPQQMYWHAQGHEYEKVERLNIKDCIECGCCSYVCPSHIPLVQYYRHAKSEIKAMHAEQQATELAKQRHEFKLARIEREKAEREARLKAKKEAVKKQTVKPTAASPSNNAKSAAAQAAARAAAAKKRGQQSTPTQSDKPISAREKAIAAAQAAAAKKQGQSDKDFKTKGQSLATNKDRHASKEAAKAAALTAAQKRRKSTANASKPEAQSNNKNLSAKPATARDRAIAAAKAAAAKKAANRSHPNQVTPPAETQPSNLSSDTAPSAAASKKDQVRQAAVAKARQAAAERQKAHSQTDEANPITQVDETHSVYQALTAKQAARQVAMAAAKRAAARRATQTRLAPENKDPKE